MIPLHRVYMPDIKIARKLASFLKAKLSLKTTTEVPRPVCGPLQFQQVASARHPTKANTAKLCLTPFQFDVGANKESQHALCD